MPTDEELLLKEEAEKRKALSKVRVFWLTLGLDALLIIYLVFQFATLAND